MAKFFGAVGYTESTETAPGVWSDVITERNYYGEITKNSQRLENGEHLNKNVTIRNSINIVSDPYAVNHVFAIRYVKWMGAAWTVTNVDVQYPRLILTLGEVYNGKTS